MSTPSHIARYTVVQPIAAGGMGEVFLARDEKLDRLVAIKLLREGFDSADLHARFEEEARNVAKLTHPNIVTIYEFGTHEGRPFIAMEYIAGHSLADIIKRQLPLSVARRVRLIEEVCSGLAHAHKAHLIHRDVKPANLMMTTSGMVKVLDFGIAKLRGTDRTQKGMIVGTVNYMSPEQITGQPVDHRSDVFAVGAVLYELLTYDQAFKGDLTTAMFAIVHGQPDPLAERCPGLDPAFQVVLNRCLEKVPDSRYQDLGQLKKDLGRLRRPLEDEESDVSDTSVPLDVDQTIVVKALQPSSDVHGKAIGPDTRRALGAALAAGEAAISAGQFESAIRYAEQALALESQNISAQDLMTRARQAREADRLASQIRRAREALGADHLDEARAALDAAATLAPESNTVRQLVAEVDKRAADLERFDRTVTLARERFEARDFAKARDLVETVALIRPDSSSLKRLRDEIERADAKYRTWLKGELAAIDEIVARRDYDGALKRAAAAAAKAPHAQELTARANQIGAAREAVARAEREAVEKRIADEERARRISELLEKARRTSEPLSARRDAAAEVVRLDHQHKEAAALVADLNAALAEAARQRALDDALAAGETLAEQGQLEAAEAKAAEVAKARPGDARVVKLRAAIAERRKKAEQVRETIGRAEAAAAAGRHAEGLALLETLDQRDQAVVAALEKIRRERAAETRRKQVAALLSQARTVAADRRVLGGLGAVAVVLLAVWLWPAPAPPVDPPPQPDPGTQGTDPPRDEPNPGGQPQVPQGPSTGPTTPGGSTPNPSGPGGPTVPPVPPKKDNPAPPVAPVRVGEGVAEPLKTAHVDPVYPPQALSARVDGVVMADITIDPSGAVRDARVRRSIPQLDQAALNAVRQWRYRPTVRDGVAVPVLMTVSVPFRLPEIPAAPNGTAKNTPPAGERPGGGTEKPATPEGPGPPVTEDSKPALEKPAPPPSAPKVDEGAALRRADIANMLTLVNRFGSAYQGRDVDGMKAAWPGMSRGAEDSFRSVFRTYSRMGWTLQSQDWSVDGDKAIAICGVQVSQTDIRGNATRTERRSYRFSFERRATGWTLINVENLGGVR